jgi:hypothetical protein
MNRVAYEISTHMHTMRAMALLPLAVVLLAFWAIREYGKAKI